MSVEPNFSEANNVSKAKFKLCLQCVKTDKVVYNLVFLARKAALQLSANWHTRSNDLRRRVDT